MNSILKALAILFIVLGFAAISLVILTDDVTLFYSGAFLQLDQLSKIGDYLSGTSAILFSISGLIFVYLSLKVQIEQLKKQIEDSSTSQNINMYSIVESKIFELSQRIHNRFQKLKFENTHVLNIKGLDSTDPYINILSLNLYLDEYLDKKGTSETDEMFAPFIKFFQFLDLNKIQFISLYELIDDSISYIRYTLPNSKLTIDQMNSIKDSFFINLGDVFIRFTDLLNMSYSIYETALEKTGKTPGLFDSLSNLSRKLSVFIEFKDQYYSTESVEKYLKSPLSYPLSHMSMSGRKKD